LTALEEVAGQPIAPPEPAAQIEALVEELKALHTENVVSFEPTCPAEEHNQSDYIISFRKFVKFVTFDEDFFDLLLCGDIEQAAAKIVHVIKLPSENLKRDLDSYQEGNVHDSTAGVKALVFYQRNSFIIKPHLTDEEVNFYDSMSNFLACVLRRAGYSVNGNLS